MEAGVIGGGGALAPPTLVEHEGLLVARDDLYPGGTKARFIERMFAASHEVVYASPCEGGAQTALATVLGRRATLFIAKRKQRHPRVALGYKLGAVYHEVSPGYLSVVQARATAYATARGAVLVPFGMDLPQAVEIISAAARNTGIQPKEFWCAGGSGVLCRALMLAWPNARANVVAVGRSLDIPGATIHEIDLPFDRPSKNEVPFPCDKHYDAKAWSVAKAKGAKGALFWNVTGDV